MAGQSYIDSKAAKRSSNSYNRNMTPTLLSHEQSQPRFNSKRSERSPISEPQPSFDKAEKGYKREGKAAPPVIVFEEEIIMKSPKANSDSTLTPSYGTSKVVSSPMEMEEEAGRIKFGDGGSTGDKVDSEGRDRFAEAMKALARQRKQARSQAAY